MPRNGTRRIPTLLPRNDTNPGADTVTASDSAAHITVAAVALRWCRRSMGDRAIAVLATLTLIANSACVPPGVLGCPEVVVTSRTPIPLCFFDTAAHAVTFEFGRARLSGRLVVDGTRPVDLPERTVPLKTLALTGDRMLLVVRELWSGRIHMYSVELSGGTREEVSLPESLRGSLFRQACAYDDQVLLVLYDVHAKRNILLRWVAAAGGKLVRDEHFTSNLTFEVQYGYEYESNILTGRHGKTLYIASAKVCYTYSCGAAAGAKPVLERFVVDGDVRLLELAASDAGVVGLYHDRQACPGGAHEENAATPFFLFDLVNRTCLPLPAGITIPFDLRYENGNLRMANLERPSDVSRVFLLDMRQAAGSGLLQAGTNNDEGQVPWAQVYYLNAFIDLLTAWDEEGAADAFADIRPLVKVRLDWEMSLLDGLLDDGNPGLWCKVYSMNREPVIWAVQTGKVLLLMKRYLNEAPQPLPLRNFEKLQRMTTALDSHIEVIAVAAAGDPWVKPGRRYLKWPKGTAAPFDGVGIPYNHQDIWATAVTYGLDEDVRETESALAARDVIELLLDTEGLITSPPPDYGWRYWWGQARAGWTAEDGVSVNTPVWGRELAIAIPRYCTYDAIGALTVSRLFPELLPQTLLDYFCEGAEQGGLEPFLNRELRRRGREVHLSPTVAYAHLRMDAAPDFRNVVWAYKALQEVLNDSDKD